MIQYVSYELLKRDIGGKKDFMRKIFIRSMLIGVVCFVLFVLVSTIAYQTITAHQSAVRVASQNIEDLSEYMTRNGETIAVLTESYQEGNVAKARALAKMIAMDDTLVGDTVRLRELGQLLGVQQIAIVNADGILVSGNDENFLGYDFKQSEQTKPFLGGVYDANFELAQEPQMNATTGEMFQYIGVGRQDASGIIQIGVVPRALEKAVESNTLGAALQTFTPSDGHVILASTPEGVIEGARNTALVGKTLSDLGFSADFMNNLGKGSYQKLDLEKVYAFGTRVGDDIIISAVPKDTMDKGRNEQVVTMMLINLLLFAGLTWLVLYLLNQQVIEPITKVEKWASRIADGDTKIELDSDMSKLEKNPHNEVMKMTKSFNKMVETVRHNVETVKRVADGDMTVFVNVRSEDDELGKSLYRMVQTNDKTYADMLEVSSRVLQGANHIAEVNNTVSERSTIQVNTIDSLAIEIAEVTHIAERNEEDTKKAHAFTAEVQESVAQGKVHMDELVGSMDEITLASGRISKIIQVIEDIAFQTNILALNASVEAARAGVTGKGFAVVAEEVGNLASKSAEAAKATRQLIESSVEKTLHGTEVAAATVSELETIVGQVQKFADIMTNIAKATEHQSVAIERVNAGIAVVKEESAANVHLIEESWHASQDVQSSGQVLRRAMDKFKLRQREEGKAYIPPEKANDTDFIQEANANYQRYLQSGESYIAE